MLIIACSSFIYSHRLYKAEKGLTRFIENKWVARSVSCNHKYQSPQKSLNFQCFCWKKTLTDKAVYSQWALKIFSWNDSVCDGAFKFFWNRIEKCLVFKNIGRNLISKITEHHGSLSVKRLRNIYLAGELLMRGSFAFSSLNMHP